MKTFSLVFVSCTFYLFVAGQASSLSNDRPTIGQPCPEFSLHHIAYFHRQEASLHDFRGKWLVLDFWNKYCGNCIASFPKVNEERKKFTGKVDFIMIGIQDRERKIQSMYQVLQKRQNLGIPIVFDSVLARRWNIFASPCIILIDDKGVVQAKTPELDSAHLEAFLENKHPDDLYPVTEESNLPSVASHDNSNKLDRSDTKGPSDDTSICESKLSHFSFSRQKLMVPTTVDGISRNGNFLASGVSLPWLYNYAYFGTMDPAGIDDRDTGYGRCRSKPILEVRDTSLFQARYSAKNLFICTISLPLDRANVENLKTILQTELKSVFGFNVTIQQRAFPCWRLTTTPNVRNKLRSKGGKLEFVGEYNGSYEMGFSATNLPFHYIFDGLCGNAGHSEVLINDTRIEGNVDLKLEGPLLTIADIKKALSTVGIDMSPTVRKMNVLVISDP